MGFWKPSKFRYVCELSMMGVVFVVASAVIRKCHWKGVTVYVTYEITSPGNPIWPGWSTSENVMEAVVCATTVQLR